MTRVREKVYKILIQSDIWLEGNGTSFSLYPGDYFICEETEHHGIVKNVYSHKITTLKFKMAAVSFTKVPQDFQTLNLKRKSNNLRCRTFNDRWISINSCLEKNIIEDITLSYQRDQKIENLLYEKETE
jgi:hypothetical protein